MFKKIAIAMAVATAIGGVASNAVAGSATANLNVTATVSTNCSAATTAVAFGAYDPLVTNGASGSDIQISGKVTVTCTKNAGKSPDPAVTIALGNGGHFSSSARHMLGGTNGDLLTYELYLPSGTAPSAACNYTGPTIWNATNILTPTGTTGWGVTSAKDFNVCGLLFKGQDVSGTSSGESYTDVVVATVTF